MKRRTLLQSLAAAFTTARLWPKAAVRAQTAATLTEANVAALTAMAEVVLPSSLDAANRDAVVSRFVNWVRNYREGADRGQQCDTEREACAPGEPRQLIERMREWSESEHAPCVVESRGAFAKLAQRHRANDPVPQSAEDVRRRLQSGTKRRHARQRE